MLRQALIVGRRSVGSVLGAAHIGTYALSVVTVVSECDVAVFELACREMSRPTCCRIGSSGDTWEQVDRLLRGEDMLRLWTAYQSRFIQDEEGASMVEYALLVALIAVVVIAAALFLGEAVSEKFSEVGQTLNDS